MDDRVSLEVARLRLEREAAVEREQEALLLREIQAMAHDLGRSMRGLEQRQAQLMTKLKDIGEGRAKEKAEAKKAREEEAKKRKAKQKEKEDERDGSDGEGNKDKEKEKGTEDAQQEKEEKEGRRGRKEEEKNDRDDDADSASARGLVSQKSQKLHERLSKKRYGSDGASPKRPSDEVAGILVSPARRKSSGAIAAVESARPTPTDTASPSPSPGSSSGTSPVADLPAAEVLTTGALASIITNATKVSKEDASRYLQDTPKMIPTLVSSPLRGVR